MAEILKFTGAKVLQLGMIDQGAFLNFKKDRKAYFEQYHEHFYDNNYFSSKEELFRGEGYNEWVKPKSIKGNDISALQGFLTKHGFMPFSVVDGVFGYMTLASVRLFQEYVRTLEDASIGIPDGRVGPNTYQHMKRWKEEGLYSQWAPIMHPEDPFSFPIERASAEYLHWFKLLNKTKDDFIKQLEEADDPSEHLDLFKFQELKKFPERTDSLPIADWTFATNDIHIIGLRCNRDVIEKKRNSDDLFILLMNGLVFKFWGSTDPRPAFSDSRIIKGFEPYLIEGQHKYQFGWHKLNNFKAVYKALKPFSNGVLVFRDWDKNDALNPEDIREGLQHNPTLKSELSNPNTSINVHWSGDGNSNWSAGCQVISGRSYINHTGDLIDCQEFSATYYRHKFPTGQPAKAVSSVTKPNVKYTRGAYTFLSDFVQVYSGNRNHVLFTLGRDGTTDLYGDEKLMNSLASDIVLKHLSGIDSNQKKIVKLVDLMKNPKKVNGAG